MNCQNCGAQLAPGVRFCGACGARVGETANGARDDDELTRLAQGDEETRVARDTRAAEATRVAARSLFDDQQIAPARVERLGAAQESQPPARTREPQAIVRQ